MGRISAITLPDNVSYDLAVKQENIVPIDSKTFTGVIGTANDFANATFYYGKIMPDDFYEHWYIKFRIKVVAAGRNDSKSEAEVFVSGTQSTMIAYSSRNQIANTSYRPAYYHELYRCTITGFNSNYGHLLGIRLLSSWNPTTVANARSVEIEIYECHNCAFMFFDAMLKYSDCPGAGSVNYTGYSEMNFADIGFKQSGDANTYDALSTVGLFNVGPNAVFANTLIMQTADMKMESIVLSSTTGIKQANLSGFLPGNVFASTSSYSANVTTNSVYNTWTSRSTIDGRFSFNGITTSASTSAMKKGKPVFLVGTIQNGLFYLDSSNWFSQELPTIEDGKAYIHIGFAYDPYRHSLLTHNPVYMYKNGAIRQVVEYALISDTVNQEPDFVIEKSTDSQRTFVSGINTITLSHAKTGYTCYFQNLGNYRTSNDFYVHVKQTSAGSVVLDVVNTKETAVTKSIGDIYWICVKNYS